MCLNRTSPDDSARLRSVLDRLVLIENVRDPRIVPYVQVRERDVSGRHGGFIAEGEVVLRVLARTSLHRPRSVLIAENRVRKLAPIFADLGEEVEIFVASQALMAAIAGFAIHRGVLAFGERGEDHGVDTLLGAIEARAIVVGLFGVSNHDNVGGVFRNAAAFGARGVVLDGACCDPLYRKAIRVSVGASLITPFARFARDEDPLTMFARHGFTTLALSPAGAIPLDRIDPAGRTALLLGAEGEGLPENILKRATPVAIRMAKGVDSLNVATASGIALHHLARHIGIDDNRVSAWGRR